jgi:hypothetical protein
VLLCVTGLLFAVASVFEFAAGNIELGVQMLTLSFVIQIVIRLSEKK